MAVAEVVSIVLSVVMAMSDEQQRPQEPHILDMFDLSIHSYRARSDCKTHESL